MTTQRSNEFVRRSLNRRGFLGRMLQVGGGALALTGCGYFSPEVGPAYAAWAFPGGEVRPERIAVGAAILAANPHNTQPWRFRASESQIDLFFDPARSLGPMDPLGREAMIGLGCALENLVLAAEANGRRVEVTLTPEPSNSDYVARVMLTPGPSVGSGVYDQIPHRHTNRGAYLDTGAPDGLEAALVAHLGGDVHLHYATGGEERTRFIDGTIAATRAIVADTEMNEASHAWWRQTKAQIDHHKDGLTMDATGQNATINFFGKTGATPSAATAGDYWIANTEGFQTTGSAFVILSTSTLDSLATQLEVGRAYQRMHLWATSVELAMQPLNQMAERRDRELELGLPPEFDNMLAALTSGRHAQMLFRIGYAWESAGPSPRRPVPDVLGGEVRS